MSRASKKISTELGYVRDDVVKALVGLRRLPGRVSPAARASAALGVGVLVLAYGVSTWAPPLAIAIVGVAIIIYGAVLVDLDDVPARRRRGQ